MPPNIQSKPGSVVFTKVRVKNLPLSGQENDSPLVRVSFGVADGHAAAETSPLRRGADGSVEWTNHVELKVKKMNVLIFAVIYLKSTKQGESWTKFDGGRFEGPVVHKLPGVWECTPNGPTGPSLYAELKVHEDGSVEGDGGGARPAPMIRDFAQKGSGSSGDLGNSGSYDSFSQATSGSSSVYEDARDDAPPPAPREELPTVDGVVVPLASGPESSSGHRRRGERSSWTAGSSQPPPVPLMRRARSGGSAGRERARLRRRQSSSHSQELSIPEESSPQPVGTLPSPVGNHKRSSLLREDIPLQKAKEGADNASASSRARETRRVHSGPPRVHIQRQEGADAPASSTAVTTSHARARSISEGSEQTRGCLASADSKYTRVFDGSGAGENGRFAPAAGIEAEGQSKEMKTEERLSSFAAVGAAPSAAASAAGAAAGKKKAWHLKCRRLLHKGKKEGEPRPPIEGAQAEQSLSTVTRTWRRPVSSATSATAEEVEEKETRVYRRVPAPDGLARVVRQEDRGARIAEVSQLPGRLRHEMLLQEARTRDEADVMVAAGSEEVEQATAVAGASVESPSQMEMDGLGLHPRGWEEEQASSARPKRVLPPFLVQPRVPDTDPEALYPTPGRHSMVSSTEDLTGFDDTAEYPSRPKPSAPPLPESKQTLRPELARMSSSSLSDGGDKDEDDESPATYASGSMLHDSWYSRELIADGAQGRVPSPFTGLPRETARTTVLLPPNPSIRQCERNPPRSIPPADKVIFDCFSPRAVAVEKMFELTILAYLRQQRDEAFREMGRRAAVEAGIPTAIPIMRNKIVTVKLDLPENAFTVKWPRPGHEGRRRVTRPDVREFIWTGEMAEANFTVECKPEADTGWIVCRAFIIEGDKVRRLSFGIEVVHAEVTETPREALHLETEEVRPNFSVIPLEELEFVSEIGRGVQGETSLYNWNGREGVKRVAVKRLATIFTSSPNAPSRDDLKREAEILSLLGHHPNVVDFYGICQQRDCGEETIQVVTKYEEGGSIHDALCLGWNGNGHGYDRSGSNGGNGDRTHGSVHELDAGVRIRWARQVASGLVNVHAADVVHNDVACRNALLSCRGGEAEAKLCDFGLSRLRRWRGAELASLFELESEGRDGHQRLPLKQMPKEALYYPHAFSKWSDSWMFGTFLYEMFEGRPPFADLDLKQTVRLVGEGKRLDPPAMLTKQGPDLKKLFVNCLESDYSQRPSMEEIIVRLDGCLPLM